MTSQVLGVVILVATEIMFFAGLVSAFLIGRAGARAWPPPDQPRLPVEATALNTAVLLASGVLLYLAGRRSEPWSRRLHALLPWATALGALFVALQGVEWVRLVRFGLTMTSSTYGAFFYAVVGAHALHVLAGLLALVWVARLLHGGRLGAEAFRAVRIFWYFVVGLWPILYGLVYLL
jgi:heme/copper-type cytochrome/quinol oxidase subunit 3